MRMLRAIDEKLEFWLCTGLYIYVIAMICTEVFTRYILKFSFVWAVETAIYAFIWMSYIAMARLAKKRSHLAFTSVRDSVSGSVRLAMFLTSDILLLVLSVVIVVGIYVPISDNFIFDQRMNGADLPLWIATAAVPVGWALLVVRVVQRSLVSINEYRQGQPLTSGAALGE